MPKSFMPVAASLQGAGVLIHVEEDMPWQLSACYFKSRVPADLNGRLLEIRCQHEQEMAIASWEKRGWIFDGGSFWFNMNYITPNLCQYWDAKHDPLAEHTGYRWIGEGFAWARTSQDIPDEDVQQVTGAIQYNAFVHGDTGAITYRPKPTGFVNVIFAARFRHKAIRTEIVVPDDGRELGHLLHVGYVR